MSQPPNEPPLGPPEPPVQPSDTDSTPELWALALGDPLFSDDQRYQLREDMGRIVRTHTSWAAAYLAGILVDTTRVLPPDDPWNEISGTLNYRQILFGPSAPPARPDGTPRPRDTGNNGHTGHGGAEQRPDAAVEDDPGSEPVAAITAQRAVPGFPWARTLTCGPDADPRLTGARTPTGRPFGSFTDFTDLMPLRWRDRYPADLRAVFGDGPILAPVGHGLDDVPAALLAFAFRDPDRLHRRLIDLYAAYDLNQIVDLTNETCDPAGDLLDAVAAAVRWLRLRRRCYGHIDDQHRLVRHWLSGPAARMTRGWPLTMHFDHTATWLPPMDSYCRLRSRLVTIDQAHGEPHREPHGATSRKATGEPDDGDQ
ncbi:hypothetical protein [Nocardioides sp.]|uniref:hypothetical protein n=1 Tax=Nocardioides sp. TaxID=35761 RepID=UPI0035187207